MWLMLGTRPDIAFTVSMLSKFNARTERYASATYTLQYLRTWLSSTILRIPACQSASRIRTLLATQTTGNRHPATSSPSTEAPFHGVPENSP